MNCLVCHASRSEGARCPQCGHEAQGNAAPDMQAILKARQAFRERTAAYAPEKRVTDSDRRLPWLALGIGLLLFVFWVRTCASGGRIF